MSQTSLTPSTSLQVARHPIVLYDRACPICNRLVQFAIERDPKERLRFAPIQSDLGRRLLLEHGFDLRDITTVVVIDARRVYTRSDAVLRIAREMSGLWPLLTLFRIIPRPLRDFVYNRFTHRLNWEAEPNRCWLPTPENRRRFLHLGAAT